MEELTMTEEHKGSRELYDHVANWDSSTLLFSKEYKWKRWGVLGILADYVVATVPGDIIEIGVCESSIYLSYIADKYNRKIYHNDIQWSVIYNCTTVKGYFGKNSILCHGSSDEFFSSTKFDNPIALSFIDVDHSYEQIVMSPDGYVFMHDTSPLDKGETELNRSGTVYKLRREIEANPEFEIFTFHNTAWDAGLSMVRKRIFPYNGE
jgi:hypothetical protein